MTTNQHGNTGDDAILLETLAILARHGGNISATARELGLTRTGIRNRLDRAAQRNIKLDEINVLQGISPEHGLTHPIPSPLTTTGVTFYYDDKGVMQPKWVKTKVDDLRRQEAVEAVIAGMAEQIVRAKPVAHPAATVKELLNLYTFTDCHVGMKAWKPETGDDWDLDIAERVLCRAFDYLIEASPAAAVGLVNQLGDFLHFDSLLPITPTSSHVLDADSRYSKVVKVATKIIRYIVNKALTKHELVVLLIAEGNHDIAGSVWLRHLFSLLYENEPRVMVIDSEMPYYVYVHGKAFLGFHHGHLKKNDQLPLTFAAQFPVEWGRTEYREAHTGHMHHTDEKEHSGLTVVQHPTIAARDAHASRHAWIAARRISSITYHAGYGRVGTNVCVPEMLV